MFTQFLGLFDDDKMLGVLMITTIFTFNNLIAFSIWTMVGDRMAGVFRSPDTAGRLNMMFGGILAAVAVWMLLS